MARIDEKAKERIFVALDYDNIESAKKLVEELGDNISMYKVGLEREESISGLEVSRHYKYCENGLCECY